MGRAPLELPFAGSLLLAPFEPEPLVLLNPAARIVWEGLRDGRPGNDIEAALATACGISKEAARANVAEVDAVWREAGVLTGSTLPGGEPDVAFEPPPGGSRRVYALCGVPIAVRFVPPSLRGILAPRFAHSVTAAEPIAELTVARCGEGYVLQGPVGASRHATEESLIGAFVRRYVELSYPSGDWLAVLHAAAVVGPSGDVLLLPGPNGSGKSTLVAGLLAAGYGYLSDDCVPIAGDCRVVPVPFALCLKRASWSIAAPLLPAFAATPPPYVTEGRRYFPVRRVVREPGRARQIVFPHFVAGATPRLDPLDPAETLTRLVAGRAWISRDPEKLRAALDLLEALPAHGLTYGCLSDALAALASLSLKIGLQD